MAFANLATVTASYCQIMANLTATNKTLTKQIIEQDLLITSLQMLAGGSNRAPNTTPTKRRPLPNNTNYCWTHGWVCSDKHTSLHYASFDE
jgi:hypothetical protein